MIFYLARPLIKPALLYMEMELKPDELLLNGEDKELLSDFAQTFGLRLTFGDFDLSAILSVR
jgi:hypothetical protein